MRPRTRVVTAAVAMTMSAVVAGCTSGGEDAEVQPVATTAATTTTAPTTTTTRATTTTTSRWSPDQQAAVDAYLAFYDAFYEIQTSGGPSNELADFASGEFLTKLRIAISQDRSNGLAARRPERSIARAEIKSVQSLDASWVVESCEVDDLVLYRAADASVVDDNVVTRRYLMTLSLIDGTLKVTDQQLADKSDGDQVERCVASR